MFRSNFDHPQGDIYFFFFTSVTKGKIIWFVVACLLYLLCFVLILFVVWLLLYSNNQTRESINTKHNKYNRHATTIQIILPLVSEVKGEKISP